jgi:hypothetical protein
MQLSYLAFYCESRKDWMLEILDKLHGAKLPFAIKNEQNFAAMERKLSDGSTLFAAYNINYDPVKNLAIRCGTEPTSIKVLTPAGSWDDVKFTWDGDAATLELAVPSIHFAVLKIK